MTRPDRTSVAGARYLDLQRKARQSGRPTDELIQLYALECFLDRLTQSAFAKNLVLKGGVLLAGGVLMRSPRKLACFHQLAGLVESRDKSQTEINCPRTD